MKVPFYAICFFFSAFVFYSCQSTQESESTQNKITTTSSEVVVNAKSLYAMYCEACHGADGKAGVGDAKDLALSTLTDEGIVKMISQGSENKKMMAYGNLLSDKEIDALAKYVLTLRP